jgi:hypothetical protein
MVRPAASSRASFTTPAAIGEVLGMPAVEAVKLLEAAAAWLGVQVPGL